MIDAPTLSLLQEIIRRESRSLLQYVSDSFPWVTVQERQALARLHQMIDEERRGVAVLGRLLSRSHLPSPYLGLYPEPFTSINYVSLDHLLPILIDRQRQALSDLERDLTCLYEPEARAEVQKILEMKQRHVQELEQLATPRAAAVR